MPQFIGRFCVAATAAALAFAFSGAVAPVQAKTLKWITFKPEAAGDAQSISTKWFVEEFKKRTGGKDTIQMFWGGSVAKSKEIPDALSGGVGDIGDIITPYFPDKFPLNNAIGYFIPQPHSTIEIARADAALAPAVSAVRQGTGEVQSQGRSVSGRWRNTASSATSRSSRSPTSRASASAPTASPIRRWCTRSAARRCR